MFIHKIIGIFIFLFETISTFFICERIFVYIGWSENIIPFAVQINIAFLILSSLLNLIFSKRLFISSVIIQALIIRYFLTSDYAICFLISQLLNGVISSFLYKEIRLFGNDMEEISKALDIEYSHKISAKNLIVNSLKDIHILNKALPENSFTNLLTLKPVDENLFCFQEENIINSDILAHKKVLLICNNKELVETFLDCYKNVQLTVLTSNIEIFSINLHKTDFQKVYYQKGITFLGEFQYVIDLFEVDPYNYQIYRSILYDLRFETNRYIYNYVKSPFIDNYIMNVYKRLILSALSQKKTWSFASIECGFLQSSRKFEQEIIRSGTNKIPMEFECYFTSISQFLNKLTSIFQIGNLSSTTAIVSTAIQSNEILRFFYRNLKKKIKYEYEIEKIRFYITDNRFDTYDNSIQGIFEPDYSIEDKIISKYFNTKIEEITQ